MAVFKRDRTICQDEHRSDRPNESTTSEIGKKIHKMQDRRLLAIMVGILKPKFWTSEHVAIWVSRLLTMKRKQRLQDVSFENLVMFHRNKAVFASIDGYR